MERLNMGINDSVSFIMKGQEKHPRPEIFKQKLGKYKCLAKTSLLCRQGSGGSRTAKFSIMSRNNPENLYPKFLMDCEAGIPQASRKKKHKTL